MRYFYSNNGFSWRIADASMTPSAGEIEYDGSAPAPSTWLAANFPQYSAIASAQALAAQAGGMLAAGCQIQSTGSPTLTATYPVDAASQQHISAEVTSILLNGTFADGSASIQWQDIEGAEHTFDIAHYKALATAIGAMVSGCLKVINGTSTTLPAQPAVIP